VRQLARAFGQIDGRLCWGIGVEGLARVTRRGKWTAIAFWDRSSDPRPNSNSAFIARGDLTFEQVVRIARHRYPEIWKRFTFEVVQGT
jgi:hypothetical protein